MPIRIRNRGKRVWRAELVESAWFLRNDAKTPEACDANRKSQIRLLESI